MMMFSGKKREKEEDGESKVKNVAGKSKKQKEFCCGFSTASRFGFGTLLCPQTLPTSEVSCQRKTNVARGNYEFGRGF